MGLPTPDWSTWIHRPNVTCWEAIALARNVDPYSVTYWLEVKNQYWFGDEKRGSGWESNSTGRAKQQRVWLDTLVNVAKDSKTRPFNISPYSIVDERTEIPLPQFAAWAVHQMKWGVPSPLSEIANNTSIPATLEKWPWGDYETALLEHLNLAATEFWAKWDGNAASAPKNDVVAAWLDARGVSGNIAAAMATILRSDKVPDGPRPRSTAKGNEKA
jgi:hypothetical protein